MNAPLSSDRVIPAGGYRGYWSRTMTDADYMVRLLGRCKREGDCLRWQGTKNPKGYGQMSYRNHIQMAHRLVYMLKIGPIPPGMLVCHTCDVRDCCTADHLFLGTEKDNNRDCGNKGRHHNSRKTHCKRGHEYTFENTYLKVTPTTVMRGCKACMLIKMREEIKNGKALARQRRRRARIKAQRQVSL